MLNSTSKTRFWINATDVSNSINLMSDSRADSFKSILEKLVVAALNNGGDLPENEPIKLRFKKDEFDGNEDELRLTTKQLLCSPELLGLRAVILDTLSDEESISVIIILFYSRYGDERIR